MLQKPQDSEAAPSVTLRRSVALDILRGLAILGTFATNGGIFLGGVYSRMDERDLAEPSPFSTLRLRRFKRGPVEWLWHWMYGRLARLTNRKRA